MTEPATITPFGRTHWAVIAILAVVGLLQPALGLLGVYGLLGRPWGPLLVALAIAVCWVAVVVVRRVPRPLPTLVLVGGIYGVLAVVLEQVLLLYTGYRTPSGGAMVSAVLSNLVWGALLGLIALGLIRLRQSRRGD
ncbi:hypothetical protein [Actinopolyspora mortivallis]|uniref:hypothetical protein n=1 Tax=Actinopolyspora mortivallis TaxID=33906 RepID=UPI00037453D1|nr:hypothetical protein [Actinopolyspora mortivallis]